MAVIMRVLNMCDSNLLMSLHGSPRLMSIWSW
jgi:hypothetical protein